MVNDDNFSADTRWIPGELSVLAVVIGKATDFGDYMVNVDIFSAVELLGVGTPMTDLHVTKTQSFQSFIQGFISLGLPASAPLLRSGPMLCPPVRFTCKVVKHLNVSCSWFPTCTILESCPFLAFSMFRRSSLERICPWLGFSSRFSKSFCQRRSQNHILRLGSSFSTFSVIALCMDLSFPTRLVTHPMFVLLFAFQS